jgi:hypothetical protein
VWYTFRVRVHGESASQLPVFVSRLLKSYDLRALHWTEQADRYAIVREILERGSVEAREWLDEHLTFGQVRELLTEFRGAGFDEPARARLRQKYNLTLNEIPARPFVHWKS